jgi:hypothetical protein
VTKRQALLLRVFAIWTIWVWATRIWNIVRDPAHDAGFKAVHSVLALVSILLAIAALVVVHRVRARRAPAEAEPETATTSRGA